MSSDAATAGFSLSLVGVPNCGKTALFNRLTGSRQKVANYPGVTVERKEGRFVGPTSGRAYRLLDLPGAYSLQPTTLDEAITRDIVLGRHASEQPPDLIVCVVDATNLRLNLRLVLELKRLGRPMVVALNMSDLARARGFRLDGAALVAGHRPAGGRDRGHPPRRRARAGGAAGSHAAARHGGAGRVEFAGGSAAEIQATQAEVRRILDAIGYRVPARLRLLQRLDALVLHPVSGPLLLAVVLFLMFQAVFSWAKWPMDAVQNGMAGAGQLGRRAPERWPAAASAGGWRDRRRRQRAGVPAADPDPVRLHPGAGGLRLSAARGVPARSADGQGRPLRPRLHPAAVELRLRHPRHHGHAHHSRRRATA